MNGEGEFAARALLAPEPLAASRARSFIKDTLRSWRLSDITGVSGGGSLADDAVLLVSELVANAVQHAGTDLEVTCKLAGGALEVAVTDRHPARALPDPPLAGGPGSAGGLLTDPERRRGLMLPSALASAWGVTYTDSAKTVWFRLRLPSAAEPASEVPVPGVDDPREPQREIGNLHFDELVRHTVEAARVAMSLERLRLSELERARRGRVAFLAEASELLSSTLDQRQAIALTAQLMVPRLASWCAVFLADDFGTMRPAYVWHEDESRIDVLARLLDEIEPPVLSPGTPDVPISGIPAWTAQSWSLAVPSGTGSDATRMASDSAWCLPLAARGRGLGAVVIGRPRADRRWQDPPPRESLELAEDLTRRAALALDNARLYERQRMTSQALQHSLLPPELPEIPRTELAAEYEAAGEANEVGGDFYDVFEVAPGRWRFAIGDVCGTGPEAAAVTGLARHTLRILAAEGHSIADVVSRLNELIIREGPRGRFITLLHGEITVPESGPLEVTLVCAGHPLPLLLRASAPAGEKPLPAAKSQMLLGVAEDCAFDSQSVRLFPGDLLLCVTDGVTERRDENGRLLDDDDGLARMLADCRELSAWAVASRMRRAVSEFGPEPSSDDMAVLVIRAA